MFLIRTRIGPSPLDGTGVFAAEPVAAGAPMWRYEPAFRAYLDACAQPSTDLDGATLLCRGHAKFLNHGRDPNTAERPVASVASRPVAAGAGIACDGGAFCVGWRGFDG